MATHDNSYKNIFSHSRMVEDLLKGFVREEWVQKFDFSTLKRVNCSYVSDDLRNRADDVVWKVRWGKDWQNTGRICSIFCFQNVNIPITI